MRVLIGCARSGVAARKFRAAGHQAFECDLEPTRGNPAWHYQADIFSVLGGEHIGVPRGNYWDLFIVHPPCTYLSVSGLHWNKRRPEREQKTRDALKFIQRIVHFASNVRKFCLEQPQTCIATRLPEIDATFVKDTVQPYEFGDDASKSTVLRLRGLPVLKRDPAKRCAGRRVEWPRGSGKMVERWSNQTDSGQNRLPPSADRAEIRAITYPGIVDAWVAQWATLPTNGDFA